MPFVGVLPVFPIYFSHSSNSSCFSLPEFPPYLQASKNEWSRNGQQWSELSSVAFHFFLLHTAFSLCICLLVCLSLVDLLECWRDTSNAECTVCLARRCDSYTHYSNIQIKKLKLEEVKKPGQSHTVQGVASVVNFIAHVLTPLHAALQDWWCRQKLQGGRGLGWVRDEEGWENKKASYLLMIQNSDPA